MAAIANITTWDSTTPTPVETVLIPVSAGPVCKWRANTTDVPYIGQQQFSVSQSRDSKAGLTTVTIELVQPVLESVSGSSGGYVAAPKVAFLEKVRMQFFINERTTETNRKDLLSFITAALSATQVKEAVTKLTQPY